MSGDLSVRRLLEEVLDSGLSPEEVCRDEPELLPRVRERLRSVRRVEAQVDALLPPASPPGACSWPSAPGRSDAAPPELPGYEVQEELGRGGMGVVYRAWDRRLNRSVALKMLLAGPYARPEELERFQREAEAGAGLRHPNIVQVYDVGTLDGRPYFIMEFVEGSSLAQRLAGAPLPAGQAAGLVATLAEAVQAAHDRAIVHRDLKPANVLLAADGTPKITDFGLARRLEDGPGLTHSGAQLGTPSYMAPEQARGEKGAIGPAADVYTLGATLYECLTGRPPFRAETASATLQQVLADEPAPPARLNPQVPRDLETICLKCLHKDPHKRYPSAAALAEDLHRFQRNEPIVARPVGLSERALRWTRRNPTAAALVATALALLGSALCGGVWLVQQAAERRAERRNEARLAVAQAVSLRKQFQFHEARQLLEQARQRLERPGPDDLRQRVDQELADLALVANLDMARVEAASAVEGSCGPLGAEPLYEEALAKAGLGRPGDNSETVAARVRGSAVRDEIVAALDDWASFTEDPARQAWLLAVARRADPDPSRDRLRRPELWHDGPELTRVVRELRVEELSPQLLTALGRVSGKTGRPAVPLLSAAQARYPQDFWLNYELGWALNLADRHDEARGYFRAALVLRPESGLAHNALGVTLRLISWPSAAARAAVRASAGQGSGESGLGDPQRAGLRRHALNWLRTCLELKTRLLQDGKAVSWSWMLSDWQTDPALASVRDRAALLKLPDAERDEWQRLWADVAALIAASPLEQGLAHAKRREWHEAADCYAHALQRGSTDDGHVWFEYAAVLLLSGDRPGYANACARMVQQYGKGPNLRAYHVARACTLAPVSIADASLPGRLTETELKDNAEEFWSLTEQGALSYRAGRFPEAVARFEQSLRAERVPGKAVLNWLWLALAQQRLGRADQARRWLDKATEWLDQYQEGMPACAEEELGLHVHNWLEAHVLRREAEALIRPAGRR